MHTELSSGIDHTQLRYVVEGGPNSEVDQQVSKAYLMSILHSKHPRTPHKEDQSWQCHLEHREISSRKVVDSKGLEEL